MWVFNREVSSVLCVNIVMLDASVLLTCCRNYMHVNTLWHSSKNVSIHNCFSFLWLECFIDMLPGQDWGDTRWTRRTTTRYAYNMQSCHSTFLSHIVCFVQIVSSKYNYLFGYFLYSQRKCFRCEFDLWRSFEYIEWIAYMMFRLNPWTPHFEQNKILRLGKRLKFNKKNLIK